MEGVPSREILKLHSIFFEWFRIDIGQICRHIFTLMKYYDCQGLHVASENQEIIANVICERPLSVKDIGSDGEDVRKSETPTPEVDDEGYSKQPPASSASANDPWSDFNQTKTFDSSSDDSGESTTNSFEIFCTTFYYNFRCTYNFSLPHIQG